MSDIFISYASENRLQAEWLAQALKHQGWSVWWDRTIPPGQTFDVMIEEALQESRCVIVIWSEAAVASQWVRAEAGEGLGRGILIPVLIQDISPPLAFRQIHAAGLIGWDGEQNHAGFRQLLDALVGLLGEPIPVEAEATPKIESQEPEQRTSGMGVKPKAKKEARRKAEAAKRERAQTEVRPRGEEEAKRQAEHEKAQRADEEAGREKHHPKLLLRAPQGSPKWVILAAIFLLLAAGVSYGVYQYNEKQRIVEAERSVTEEAKREAEREEAARTAATGRDVERVTSQNLLTIAGRCESTFGGVQIFGLREADQSGRMLETACRDGAFTYAFEHAKDGVSEVLVRQWFAGRAILYRMKRVSAANRGQTIEFSPRRYSINGLKTAGQRFQLTASCQEQGAIYEMGLAGARNPLLAACDGGLTKGEIVSYGGSHHRVFVRAPEQTGGTTRWGNWWYGATTDSRTVDIRDLQAAPPSSAFVTLQRPDDSQIFRDPGHLREWLRDPFILGTTGSLFHRSYLGAHTESDDWRSLEAKVGDLCDENEPCWRIANLDEIELLANALGSSDFFEQFASVQIQGGAINLLGVANADGGKVVFGIQARPAPNNEVALDDASVVSLDYRINDIGLWLVRDRNR